MEFRENRRVFWGPWNLEEFQGPQNTPQYSWNSTLWNSAKTGAFSSPGSPLGFWAGPGSRPEPQGGARAGKGAGFRGIPQSGIPRILRGILGPLEFLQIPGAPEYPSVFAEFHSVEFRPKRVRNSPVGIHYSYFPTLF